MRIKKKIVSHKYFQTWNITLMITSMIINLITKEAITEH